MAVGDLADRPGLGAQPNPESATASRERRRVALAVREACSEISFNFRSRFDALESTMARIEQKVGAALSWAGRNVLEVVWSIA